ncbi:prepilin-type N-terminal cleavage/methylation domain-containing protein [Thiomicrorhabdus sp. zzn3]|uniref:prepilin-type N-terminal cleavage/methylation domain-containing protein n=1 Tax=Thiomicrorhabdus sp. zzn3 TaxID=3039775 RepID=UPI002436755B|nr:prepilin-type N-terminal cleavage/methylation domain-containing protein [Thiomicrorhabdus sp. zzn3]MDG6779107.1 prepilin-type N-terminal cleavage/methylation domain-containing protein [Thiomicrorhabdus sp. zzn3]
MKNMETQTRLQNQKGFTLVEIAIVLVIIGLLLGGVLKGQEMINAAKIKNDTDTLKALQASAYAYRDRAGFYPGTLRSANPTNNALNGIEIQADVSDAGSANTTADNLFFGDLANEGFIKSPNFAPEVDDGGAVLVGYGTGAQTPVWATTDFTTAPTLEDNKNYVCLSYSTATDNAEAIAVGMDIKLDDGVANTGIVRYSSDPAGGANICLEI